MKLLKKLVTEETKITELLRREIQQEGREVERIKYTDFCWKLHIQKRNAKFTSMLQNIVSKSCANLQCIDNLRAIANREILAQTPGALMVYASLCTFTKKKALKMKP